MSYKSQHNDLKEIAKCHSLCFPDSLATRLGNNYIMKTLEWFLASENRFLFHEKNEAGEVIGYCGGYIPKGVGDGSTSGMIQYAFREAFIGVLKKPWLLFNVEVVALYPLIFKNVKKKLQSFFIIKQTTNKYTKHYQVFSGLVVIGVIPVYQGKGIFNKLMEAFIIESKHRNAVYATLSVKKNNDRGIAAYKKFGWHIEKENDNDTYVLVKQLK